MKEEIAVIEIVEYITIYKSIINAYRKKLGTPKAIFNMRVRRGFSLKNTENISTCLLFEIADVLKMKASDIVQNVEKMIGILKGNNVIVRYDIGKYYVEGAVVLKLTQSSIRDIAWKTVHGINVNNNHLKYLLEIGRINKTI